MAQESGHAHPAPVPRLPAAPAQGRHGTRDHCQLAQLDAGVERGEGQQAPLVRKSQLPEHAREAEAVQQAEPEHDGRTPAGEPIGQHVLDRDPRDRQRDERLDDARGEGDDVERGQGESDRVGDGEGRDLPDQGPETRAQQEQRQYEEDVIRARRQYVDEAEAQVTACRLSRARRSERCRQIEGLAPGARLQDGAGFSTAHRVDDRQVHLPEGPRGEEADGCRVRRDGPRQPRRQPEHGRYVGGRRPWRAVVGKADLERHRLAVEADTDAALEEAVAAAPDEPRARPARARPAPPPARRRRCRSARRARGRRGRR